MTAFARPFNLLLPDDSVLHGTEFPSGRIVIDHHDGQTVYAGDRFNVCIAADFPGARIVRLGRREKPTARQLQILAYAAEGHTNAWIAHTTGLSVHAVKAHLREAYMKLGVTDRASAAEVARQAGLIPAVTATVRSAA